MKKGNGLPPRRMVRRVGWVVGDERPDEVYLARGAEQWALIKSLLPADFDLAGRRVLDFGCGAGRILRHAATEEAEVWGCDIDAASVEWLRRHLDAHVFRNGEEPPLEVPDGHFDLTWAFSVFTHLTDTWAAWLLELHRTLKPDGLLIATVFGPGHTRYGDERVGEELTGMNTVHNGAGWDTGGPLVLHSRWWLTEHWGRAFEIIELRDGDPGGSSPLYGQGVVVMRRLPRAPSVEELERWDPDDPREMAALLEGNAQLRREAIRLARDLDVCVSSRSWRMTRPLRAAVARLRAAAGRPS